MGRLFPKHGRPWDELAPEMEAAKADDMPWHSGRAHKTAFHASDEVLAVVKEAYSMFLTENALYPSGFKSLGRGTMPASTDPRRGGRKSCSAATPIRRSTRPPTSWAWTWFARLWATTSGPTPRPLPERSTTIPS